MQVSDRIIVKTGHKPNVCDCNICKEQCKIPCLGTPQDIEELCCAGYSEGLSATLWAAGIAMGLTRHIIPMIQAAVTDGYCCFYKDGLCELHDSGLKPTEGKLSTHDITLSNLIPERSIAWNVAKEWLREENFPVIENIITLIYGNDR